MPRLCFWKMHPWGWVCHIFINMVKRLDCCCLDAALIILLEAALVVAVGGYDRPRSAIVAGWLAAAQPDDHAAHVAWVAAALPDRPSATGPCNTQRAAAKWAGEGDACR